MWDHSPPVLRANANEADIDLEKPDVAGCLWAYFKNGYEVPVLLPGPGIVIPATVPLTLRLPFGAACGTALGLLGETFSTKELLFSRAKCES